MATVTLYPAGSLSMLTVPALVDIKQRGGLRGDVVGFSRASRMRLLRLLNMVRKHTRLPRFVTLTLHNPLPDGVPFRKILHRFFSALRYLSVPYTVGWGGWIWRVELQERGVEHVHMLIWSDLSDDVIIRLWLKASKQLDDDDAVNVHYGRYGNRPAVEPVRSRRGVMWYASKYLSKAAPELVYRGRSWGHWGNIPLSPFVDFQMSFKAAMAFRRAVRRTAERKRKGLSITHNRKYSLSLFHCSPDMVRLAYECSLLDDVRPPPNFPPGWYRSVDFADVLEYSDLSVALQ